MKHAYIKSSNRNYSRKGNKKNNLFTTSDILVGLLHPGLDPISLCTLSNQITYFIGQRPDFLQLVTHIPSDCFARLVSIRQAGENLRQAGHLTSELCDAFFLQLRVIVFEDGLGFTIAVVTQWFGKRYIGKKKLALCLVLNQKVKKTNDHCS